MFRNLAQKPSLVTGRKRRTMNEKKNKQPHSKNLNTGERVGMNRPQYTPRPGRGEGRGSRFPDRGIAWPFHIIEVPSRKTS